MTYAHKSDDGLLSSNDGSAVATWNGIGRRMAEEQREASRALREMGVRLEHPDDGWVSNRGKDDEYLTPCYPAFDLRPEVGDIIALGWPFRGYRLVRVTRVEHRKLLIETTRYYYEETGRRYDANAEMTPSDP